MPSSNTKHKAARQGKGIHIRSPWWNNSVRRRWTRIVFWIVILFVAILALTNQGQSAKDSLNLHLPIGFLAFLTLPLIYPLAQRLGASRATALWAMGLLGANVPWLWHLRIGECWLCAFPKYQWVGSALLPLFTALCIYFYLLLLDGHRRAWLGLAAAALAIYVCNPLAGLGLFLGILVHAAGWVRQREAWQFLLLSAILTAVGTLVWVQTIPWMLTQLDLPSAKPIGWVFNSTSTPSAIISYFLLMNAWLLPLLTLPLLWVALFTDPAARWRPSREVGILVLVILGTILVASLGRGSGHIHDVVGLIPLAAIWLAMGIAKLQVRAPQWVWLPVAILLVLTTVPQSLVSGGIRRMLIEASLRKTGQPRITTNITVLNNLSQPHPDMLVPLYPYLTRELTREAFYPFQFAPDAVLGPKR